MFGRDKSDCCFWAIPVFLRSFNLKRMIRKVKIFMICFWAYMELNSRRYLQSNYELFLPSESFLLRFPTWAAFPSSVFAAYFPSLLKTFSALSNLTEISWQFLVLPEIRWVLVWNALQYLLHRFYWSFFALNFEENFSKFAIYRLQCTDQSSAL